MSFWVKKAEIIRASFAATAEGWRRRWRRRRRSRPATPSAKCGSNLSHLFCFSLCALSRAWRGSSARSPVGELCRSFSAVRIVGAAWAGFRSNTRASLWPCALGSSSAQPRLSLGGHAGGERASVIQHVSSHARCVLRFCSFWNPIHLMGVAVRLLFPPQLNVALPLNAAALLIWN